MEIADEYLTISNGTFSLQEGPNQNKLYFYRNDHEVLGDVGRLPMEFLHAWIANKMMSSREFSPVIMNNISFQTSIDGKVIKITFPEAKVIKEEKVKTEETKKPSFIQRTFSKIFEKR